MLIQTGEYFQDKRGIASPPLLHEWMLACASLSSKMSDHALPLSSSLQGGTWTGKTTLARAMTAELGLPLINRDDIKEALYDTLGTGDVEWSSRLGSASYEVLFVVARRLLEAGTDCILETNFNRADPFRGLPAARIVQISCTAPDHVLLDRYARRERHPGHNHAVKRVTLGERLKAAEWRPLELKGELIVVDTSTPIDIVSVVRRISQAA